MENFIFLDSNPSQNKPFFKDSVVMTSRLLSINPFLREAVCKSRTNVKFSENVYKFVELIPGAGQQQYEDFVYSRLLMYHNFF